MTNNVSNAIDPKTLTPENALNNLCKISQSLLSLAEQESQALIQQDMLSFAIIQDEKEALSLRYLDASQDFRNRINVFRRINQGQLIRLESLQDELSVRTNDNNALIDQIKQKAEHVVTHGLMTAQEYANSARLKRAPLPPQDGANNNNMDTQAGA